MFPEPQLDARSRLPLYRQLAVHITSVIRAGSLNKGDRLPATRELAGLLGLNRTTITAAYELLEAEGLIRRHVGRGSFVAAGSLAGLPSLEWERLLEVDTETLQPPPLTAPEETISFATSRPSEGLFPMEEFRATTEEVIAGEGASEILQLGSPNGYDPLRRYLLNEARGTGVARAGDDIIVTSGCQQALDLLQRVLVGAGDTVVVEDPVYPGIHHVLARGGARLIGVPVGADGLETERLERVLEQEKPRAIVLTPNFQNPTGATLPRAARETILRLAKQRGTVVVENDIYGELRYQGPRIPTLKQLDEAGDVVQLRSFSKVAFPGLRVGWVIGPRALIARLAEAKQWSDLHTDQLSQAVLLRFAESGRLEAHRNRMIVAGAERLAATIAACDQHLDGSFRFTRPQGGMSVWVELPEPLDAGELLPRAHRDNVTYLPGKYFAVSRSHAGSLRLSFAGLPPDRIKEGISILGEVFRTELKRVREASRYEPAPAMV